jgi:RNA recognition motif-containing protein
VNIYVGNLAREVTEEDLRTEFSAFGQVATVTMLKDKFTGETRGFGFVEMPAAAEAQAAIEGMNGKDVKGRTLNVNEARPRKEGGPGGGGGGRGPGGGGGGRMGGGGGGGRRW